MRRRDLIVLCYALLDILRLELPRANVEECAEIANDDNPLVKLCSFWLHVILMEPTHLADIDTRYVIAMSSLFVAILSRYAGLSHRAG